MQSDARWEPAAAANKKESPVFYFQVAQKGRCNQFKSPIGDTIAMLQVIHTTSQAGVQTSLSTAATSAESLQVMLSKVRKRFSGFHHDHLDHLPLLPAWGIARGHR